MRKFPTRVYVMAMIIVVFKILYKLDGRYKVTNHALELAMETLQVREEEQWNSEDLVGKMKLILQDDTDQIGECPLPWL